MMQAANQCTSMRPHYFLCSNQLLDFFLLDKSNMVNEVPESKSDDFVCLNPVSSWRCGLWSPDSSPYSLQVLGPWTESLLPDPRNLVGRPRYIYVYLRP
jgi:hypothetical protein